MLCLIHLLKNYSTAPHDSPRFLAGCADFGFEKHVKLLNPALKHVNSTNDGENHKDECSHVISPYVSLPVSVLNMTQNILCPKVSNSNMIADTTN